MHSFSSSKPVADENEDVGPSSFVNNTLDESQMPMHDEDEEEDFDPNLISTSQVIQAAKMIKRKHFFPFCLILVSIALSLALSLLGIV